MFVKFCGFTREEDLEAAAQMPITAAGFIFFKGSERYVSPERCTELSKILTGTGILKAGIFVDDSVDDIKKIADKADLDILQVYNSSAAVSLYGFRKIITCFRIGPGHEENSLPREFPGDYILFDTLTVNGYGGSGISFDSSILREYRHLDRTIVAGGLNNENIGSLIRKIRPFGVDISSGIESSKGIKSEQKMREILKTISEAENDSTT